MRVLQLCHKPPYPPVDGGCIAINNITRGLVNLGHDLKVLTVETQKHPFDESKLPEGYAKNTGIESVYIDTKPNVVDAFASLVTQDSYNVSRFFTPDFDIRLEKLLKENTYDIIHLESLFMAPYLDTIRRCSKAKVVLRSHNLEFIIWEKVAYTTKNPAKRMYLNLLAKQLKRYELDVMERVDGIAAISDEDAKKYEGLGCGTPIVTIPFGLDLDDYEPSLDCSGKISMFHIGSMDWQPNIDGINWLITDIWPRVIEKDPKIKLTLAGRNMPEDLISSTVDGLSVVGEVDDARAFMMENDVMVVPLRFGGGMRIKIIEGMAMGKPIISTKIGAEGIACTHGKDILIADSEEDFANQILRMGSEKDLCKTIGGNARKLIEEKYNNKKIVANLVAFYEELMA